MKVKAIKSGYNGGIQRNIGDVFEIADPKFFSKNWMVNLDELGASEKKHPAELDDQAPPKNVNRKKVEVI